MIGIKITWPYKEYDFLLWVASGIYRRQKPDTGQIWPGIAQNRCHTLGNRARQYICLGDSLMLYLIFAVLDVMDLAVFSCCTCRSFPAYVSTKKAAVSSARVPLYIIVIKHSSHWTQASVLRFSCSVLSTSSGEETSSKISFFILLRSP